MTDSAVMEWIESVPVTEKMEAILLLPAVLEAAEGLPLAPLVMAALATSVEGTVKLRPEALLPEEAMAAGPPV